LPGQLAVVSHEHQSCTHCRVELEDQAHDLGRGFGVEIACGFIGKQDLRAVHKRARDRDPLLLAAGELNWVVIESTIETNAFEQIGGATARVVFAADLRRDHDVFQRGERRQKLKALKHKAEEYVTDARQLFFTGAMQSDAIEIHGSFSRPLQTGADGDQRGFSAARRTDNSARASSLNRKRNIIENLKRLRAALKKLG
jgi:hypothetical protein